jgi:hypothetical protein
MVKKAIQRGRSEQRGDAYFLPYVEPLSDARTKLADFFNILLAALVQNLVHQRLPLVLAQSQHIHPARPAHRFELGTIALDQAIQPFHAIYQFQ